MTFFSIYLPPPSLPMRHAGVIVFIFPNEPGQVAVTLVIACMFALVFEALAPYDSKWDAWISRSGHVIVLLSIFVAFLLEQEDSEKSSSSHDLYGSVLLAINVLMVLAVAVQGVTMACSVTRPAEALPRSVSLAAVGFHVQENRGRGATNRAKRSRRYRSREAKEDDQDNDIAFETRRLRTHTTKKKRSFRMAVAEFGGIVARASPHERQARVAPSTNSDDDSEE